MGKDRTLFLVDHCLTPLEKISSAGILCEKDRIIAVGGASAFSLEEEGLAVQHLNGCYALPGFIDSHIHGIGRFNSNTPDIKENTLRQMSALLARHGVTTFFPTLLSKPKKEMLQDIDSLTGMIEQGFEAADAPGLHLEGPFINPEKRGSLDSGGIMETIDLGLANELFQTGKGRIKVMTFAPELKNSVRLIELMLENGVIPSMGHSLADGAQTLNCIDAGALRCTYIFNGMPQLHHRESSLTTVALTDDRVTVEMICDGVHIHPRFVNLTARCKPPEKIVGVSNSVASPEHSGPASSVAGAQTDPAAPVPVVATPEGIISGATITLENSWQHLMNYAKMDQKLAALCFTRNPAVNLGLITRGELLPGRRADITFFDNTTDRVRMTVVRGKIIYRAAETPGETA